MNTAPVQIKKETKEKKMMSRIIMVLAVMAMLALGAGAAFAQHNNGGYSGPGGQSGQGGYVGPGPNLVSVEQAKEMWDDSHVALRGYIVQSLGDEHYLFKDDTGTVNIEIDHDKWRGQKVEPNTLVEIQGEIDKDWGNTKIDVDYVQIVKP